MEVSAETIFEAVVSKIENQCRLPAENLKSVKSRALAMGAHSKHFSLLEVECLIRQFYVLLGQESKLARPIAGMDKREFIFVLHTIFGMDTKIMIDRIFATLDMNKDGFIGVEEWVESLGVFLRGDLDEKSKHTFQVYDLNSDKCISKEEMFFLLKKGETTKSKFDEDLEDVLNMTFKDIDQDHDGILTYPYFQKLVRKDVMYLEAFGKCLPDPFAVTAFERHLAELKRVVKAKGKRELNIPRKGCLLNMSSANPTHLPVPASSERFLLNALRLANLPPVSPKGTNGPTTGTQFTYPGKMGTPTNNAKMAGTQASKSRKST